jgi:hypothetical protein
LSKDKGPPLFVVPEIGAGWRGGLWTTVRPPRAGSRLTPPGRPHTPRPTRHPWSIGGVSSRGGCELAGSRSHPPGRPGTPGRSGVWVHAGGVSWPGRVRTPRPARHPSSAGGVGAPGGRGQGSWLRPTHRDRRPRLNDEVGGATPPPLSAQPAERRTQCCGEPQDPLAG